MTENFGEVGTKKLYEDERVVVWEMRLEPGEAEQVHRHEHDYLTIQIDGDRIAADIHEGSEDIWGAMAGTRVEGDVFNGNVLFAPKGGIEAAVNIGQKTFYEIIVELKD